MKYIKTTKKQGGTRFLVDEEINLNKFRSLMKEISLKLKSQVEWIAIPEAEIAKIKMSAGEIYAKLDFEYGLELDCDGFTDHEILQIEEFLSKK